MSRFKKKPVLVEAVQVTNEWFDGPMPNPLHPKGVVVDPRSRCVEVGDVLGQRRTGRVGDWIVVEEDGKYVYQDEVFRYTYEPIEPVDAGGVIFRNRQQADLFGAFIASLMGVREVARETETCESCMARSGPLSDAIEGSDRIQQSLKGAL